MNTNQFQIEDGAFERNTNVAAALVAKFDFFKTLEPGQRVFVPDTRTESGKLAPLPIKAANKELAPAVFKARAESRTVQVTDPETGEVSNANVTGRCVYRVA